MSSTATKPSTPKANRPIETIKAGAVQASIWRNEAPDGAVYFSRRWKDAAGKWPSSTTTTTRFAPSTTASNAARIKAAWTAAKS